MNKAQGQNLITLVLGIWLFVTPWIMDFGLFMNNQNIVMWNFWIVGLAVAVSAALALRDLRPWEEWVNLALGAWLFMSPWILGYSQSQNLFWNAIVVGAAIMIFSAAALPAAQRLSTQS
jgi:hypothetical protein